MCWRAIKIGQYLRQLCLNEKGCSFLTHYSFLVKATVDSRLCQFIHICCSFRYIRFRPNKNIIRWSRSLKVIVWLPIRYLCSNLFTGIAFYWWKMTIFALYCHVPDEGFGIFLRHLARNSYNGGPKPFDCMSSRVPDSKHAWTMARQVAVALLRSDAR